MQHLLTCKKNFTGKNTETKYYHWHKTQQYNSFFLLKNNRVSNLVLRTPDKMGFFPCNMKNFFFSRDWIVRTTSFSFWVQHSRMPVPEAASKSTFQKQFSISQVTNSCCRPGEKFLVWLSFLPLLSRAQEMHFCRGWVFLFFLFSFAEILKLICQTSRHCMKGSLELPRVAWQSKEQLFLGKKQLFVTTVPLLLPASLYFFHALAAE